MIFARQAGAAGVLVARTLSLQCAGMGVLIAMSSSPRPSARRVERNKGSSTAHWASVRPPYLKLASRDRKSCFEVGGAQLSALGLRYLLFKRDIGN